MTSSPVEQIKDRLDVVEVLGSYIKLDKAGRNYKARCPFHNEKTPSFIVSPERQSFYCFGCQAKGDMFEFVQKFEGLDFRETLKLLAEKAGVELKNYDNHAHGEEKNRKEKIIEVLDAATTLYENLLASGNRVSTEIMRYLEARGIKKETIKKWRIGWAPEGWRTALTGLGEMGFKEKELLEAGLIKKTEDGSKTYDVFRGRIMFPIFDPSGEVIAFSGRIYNDLGNSPKYVNTPETLVFKKSDVLYGLHEAKSEIRRLDYTVLVEGQVDLVLSHQAGVRNTVASSGTALTESHLKRIQKLSNRCIIAYDSDPAGRSAAKRSGELALSLGMEVKIASLPDGEDPGDVILKSGDKWKELLKSSVNLVEFVIDEAVRKNKKIGELPREFNKSVIPLLSLIQSEMARSEFVTLSARKTGLPESSILGDLKKFSSKALLSNNEREQNKETSVEPFVLTPEEMLAGIIVGSLLPEKNQEEIRERFKEMLGEEFFRELVENSRFDKDTLIFETEARFDGFDISEVAQELLTRIEKSILLRRLSGLGRELDNVESDSERDKLKEEALSVSKRLSNI